MGLGSASTASISSFGATLIDDANASTARTTLGLGTAATTAATAYATSTQGSTADTNASTNVSQGSSISTLQSKTTGIGYSSIGNAGTVFLTAGDYGGVSSTNNNGTIDIKAGYDGVNTAGNIVLTQDNSAKLTISNTNTTITGTLKVGSNTNIETAIANNLAGRLYLERHYQATANGTRVPGVDWFVTNAYMCCYNRYSSPSYGFLCLVTQQGSLPGYGSFYYPTVRTDYTNLYFSAGGNYSGYITGTGAGQIDFTGQHQALPVNEDLFNNIDDYVGRIVISNGDVSSIVEDASGNNTVETGKKGITINESIPRVILCNTYKDKRVFGVISPEEETENIKSMGNRQNEKHFKQGAFVSVITGLPAEDNRIIINAIGEGAMWVINSHGNIENGDYICSSDKGEGYGCAQGGGLLHNYTCAKSTIDCSFELESDNYECKEIIINDVVFKIAFIACTYCL